MIRNNPVVAFTGLALALCASMPLLAHHSTAAEYDMSKTITIQGTVTRLEWMNPHARLWVDTKNGDGTVANWEVELPPPNFLKRMLGRPGEIVQQGDQVSVTLWRAKDGSLLGDALSMVFPDGHTMNFPAGWL